MKTSHARPRRVRISDGSIPALILLSTPLLALPACQSEESVDQKIARMIGRRSEEISADQAPDPKERAHDNRKVPGQASKDPPTTNPPASELHFDPASEARDVEKRLTQMWQETGTYFQPKEEKPLIDATVGPDGQPAPPKEPAKPGAPGQPDTPGSGQAEVEGGPAPPEAKIPEASVLAIDIQAAFKIGQRTAPEHSNQEDAYLITAIGLLLERNQWTPRFSDTITTTIEGGGDEGRFDNALHLINDLRVTQRLPYGGQAEAAWIWDATDQLRSSVTGQYRQASRFVADATIPLLKDAGLIAQESLIQADRNLIYAARDYERFRRSFLVSIANDYFQLVQLKSQISSQKHSLESFQNLEKATTALFEAGRVKEFDKNIASSNVRSALSSLLGLREQYSLTLDRFKVRLGIPVDQHVTIEDLQFEVFEPDIGLSEATALALAYRLDLQNQRDRLEDARRGVANARNQLLPDLNVTGAVTVPTDDGAREGGLFLDPDQTTYSAGLSLALPLDKRDEALRLRQAQLGLERQKRDLNKAIDDVVVDVRGALRAIELARVQLQLAEQRVEINERRLIEQNLKKDLVKPQEIVDSENDRLSSENQRDQAKTDLRNAILQYLLSSDQLRVSRDGTFQRLPGMPNPVPAPSQTPAAVPPGANPPGANPGAIK